MSDVRKWEVKGDGICDHEGRDVAFWYTTDDGANLVSISDEARRQIEALPLLVAFAECSDALAWRDGEPADARHERIATTLARYGGCSDGDFVSEGHFDVWVEELGARAVAALRGDDA